MKIENWEIGKVVPYARNPRNNTGAVDKVKASLKEFGWQQPIVVDPEGVVIVGHTRLLASKELGLTTVPVHVADNLTAEQAKAYRIIDNKSSEFAEWDQELLDLELGELGDLPILEEFSFGKEEEIEVVEDDFESEPIEEIKTDIKHGDIIQIGPHRLMCGDSTELADVDRLMDGVGADMVFTDPPYGVSYVSRVDESRRKNWGEIKNDSLSGDELLDFLIVALAPHKTPIKYICCNWQSFPDFFKAYGKPNSLIVWDKESIGLGAGYRSQHEFILFYGTLDHNSESNVWQCKREVTADYVHPTQKPIKIPSRAIGNSSKQGQIVADPFLGSGSTMVACHQLKRVCYGMELEPKYCQVIVDRMKKLDPEIKITKV